MFLALSTILQTEIFSLVFLLFFIIWYSNWKEIKAKISDSDKRAPLIFHMRNRRIIPRRRKLLMIFYTALLLRSYTISSNKNVSGRILKSHSNYVSFILWYLKQYHRTLSNFQSTILYKHKIFTNSFWLKGGLISESFSLWLKSPNKGAKSLSWALWSKAFVSIVTLSKQWCISFIFRMVLYRITFP